MRPKDKVIVIIASYNGRDYWPDLLPLLAQEKYNDFILEIVIVDNHSTDDSLDYLQSNYPQLKVIALSENTGFVGANNIGYEYAKKQNADFIYLLNQDTVITSGWLQPLYDFAKQHTCGTLQSKLLLWSDKNKINTAGNVIHFLGFGYGRKSDQPDRGETTIKKINYSSGAGVFISLAALASRGHLFDEKMFMYLEDLDLGWSLNILGYDNYLIPQSVIYHKYEFNRSLKQFKWFERNRLWVMLKNYKVATWLLISPMFIIMEIGQLFYALGQGRFLQKLRAYGWLFSGHQWQWFLIQRRQLQNKRVRRDRQVVYNFAGRILFQPLDSWPLRIANFVFGIYWSIVKQIIFW